ncbi:hypothetical protein CC2G_000140 [Coprinopsis cinerea AmutBmut pab1-1]|nr:hypothetical protein CC2G_000140 [Coprinopsis cinerea AmutBmut pab1-1]
MTLVKAKAAPSDLLISLLATKSPDRTLFPRREAQKLPLRLPVSLSVSNGDLERYQSRISKVLDVLSRAVLTDRKQVAAVAASVVPPAPGSTNLRTTLHVSLNPGQGLPTNDQIKARIRDILTALNKLTEDETRNAKAFIMGFYRYGWKRFEHQYNKRAGRLGDLESSDKSPARMRVLSNTSRKRSVAAIAFAEQYDRLREVINQEDTALPSDLAMVYSNFEKYLQWCVILRNEASGSYYSRWLTAESIPIPITRWIIKLFSLHLDARRLQALGKSVHFRGILFGDLDIRIYRQAGPSKQTIQCNDVILFLALAHLRQTFEPFLRLREEGYEVSEADYEIFKQLRIVLGVDQAKYLNPDACVHCEIFLLRRIQTEGVPILPYIGVSKLSCVPCSVYFHCLGPSGFNPVSTRGSDGKTYPGWLFPSDAAEPEDAERLAALKTKVMERLEEFLWDHIDELSRPRKSDSTVGSVDDAAEKQDKQALSD